MSSRAIRKLQKLREQEQQRESDQQDESSEDEAPRPAKPKFNAFDLLNAENEDEEEDEEEAEEEPYTHIPEPEPEPTPVKPKKSSKKKKKKAAKPSDPANAPPSKPNEADLDEIDRALKDLSTGGPSSVGTSLSSRPPPEASFPKTTSELLGIEPKFLNATNEMRRLFGNVVLENFDQPADTGTGRRRDRNRQMIDLAQALTGRYSPASRGQSLAGVTLRRNILMQGKDEWPRAPSGGLGMETVEKLPSG